MSFNSPRRYNELPAIGSAYTPRRMDTLEQVRATPIGQDYKTTQALVEKTFLISDDLVESMSMSHGSLQNEKEARHLLREYIRTITSLTHKLSKEIEIVEAQVREKLEFGYQANSAMKNLEVQQVGSIVDLRGRVARCDAAISKLSNDLKGAYDAVTRITQDQVENSTKMLKEMHQMDSKIGKCLERTERSSMEQSSKIKSVEGDSQHAMTLLDSKTRIMVEDLRSALEGSRAQQELETKNLAKDLSLSLDKHIAAMDRKQDKFESSVLDSLQQMNLRISAIESRAKEEKAVFVGLNQDLKRLFEERMDKHYSQLRARLTEETGRVQAENRKALATVHQNMSTMQSVLDTKRKILHEELKKEISLIRKIVVVGVTSTANSNLEISNDSIE